MASTAASLERRAGASNWTDSCGQNRVMRAGHRRRRVGGGEGKTRGIDDRGVASVFWAEAAGCSGDDVELEIWAKDDVD